MHVAQTEEAISVIIHVLECEKAVFTPICYGNIQEWNKLLLEIDIMLLMLTGYMCFIPSNTAAQWKIEQLLAAWIFPDWYILELFVAT